MDRGVAASTSTVPDIERLAEWLAQRSRVAVITGAGVSTESGIPDYRDGDGNWKRSPPVQYRDFVGSAAVRKRYWARSFAGWPMFAAARPSLAHVALARLEQAGRIAEVVTQNVDRLHQRAGSRKVIDLHGRLDVVRCLANGHRFDREAFQARLREENPDWDAATTRIAPDGDADLEGVDFDAFVVPPCDVCGGLLKPDVVFYGESVPREVGGAALAAIESADGLLVAGSSLMVWSSFRLVRAAVQRGIAVVAANRGRTRADDLFAFKLDGECGEVLNATLDALHPPAPAARPPSFRRG
ncbi:MAG TPA: NAD-dependent protein deacetylase [Rhodanobacteraceae bacterium]|jgi:NAD-dependent SIR2 family protein deacetylase|nr:NAD-dependent protein deacetylase [Rhodanobacteraceae bacterium]